ncbi:MAG: deoxyguanosinetriphosphate triphosphohydrolase [Chloroflexi bacterium]|nr:deoxyguanosinetriphosphate triphosphohydrolase [Chloroflexota bacterium]
MFRSRTAWQEVEALLLAPYAVSSQRSRGRAYPDDEPPYRSPFQRDRDRIIHTTAFRRLVYKTQVFIVHEGDHYRTRLTHTLEVSQIGRTMSRALGANEDLTEAICLAHDLGHTPFGHCGEEVLHELMAEHGGFDHNQQSLRIVEKLEDRYPDFRGLNLTWEVREGIAKHATEHDKGSGLGYEPHRRATLEGQITNLADELAYTAHDLDDGLRAGMAPPGALSELGLWQEVMASLGLALPLEVDDGLRHRAIRRLIHLTVTDALEETQRRLERCGVESVEGVRAQAEPMAALSPEMAAQHAQLKAFLMHHVYRHYRVNRMSAKAKRFITQLFQEYVADPRQLPEATQQRLAEDDLRRVVCDYIAGMTDRYALEEYQKLFDPQQRV